MRSMRRSPHRQADGRPASSAAEALITRPRSDVDLDAAFISLAVFFILPLYLCPLSHLEFLCDLDHSLTQWPARESSMWSKRNQDRHLWALRSQIDCAPEPTKDLVADVLYYACPRLQASLTPNDLVVRLIEAEAWIELGLGLIGWEVPDMDVHGRSGGEDAWNGSIWVGGLGARGLGEVADFEHESVALAILGALVEAQLRKVEGQAPSNVPAFRRREPAAPQLAPAAAWYAGLLGLAPGGP